jgi:hypothetical protein
VKVEKTKRHIVAISAIPCGHRVASQKEVEDKGFPRTKVKYAGNSPGVFALMSDDTIELFSTDSCKWTLLPEIPERD